MIVGADWTLHPWRHNYVGGVTAVQARHNSSNVGCVTAGQVRHNSITRNVHTKCVGFFVLVGDVVHDMCLHMHTVEPLLYDHPQNHIGVVV